MRLTTFIAGATAGYVMGTKAGRKRYEQIRRGYEAAINSPVAKSALHTGRKALANALDPEPRMRELRTRDIRTRNHDTDTTIYVPDED
ncbi:hypothetical protein [Corynebacterium pseudokroppenstedtii]|mgnify:CR=1 FL=1|uniref:hypothetical protein n=1 Tax=Corynebacterium pseudokroppenstedtii TaxID=2804917 RepID=UPI00351D2DAC